jgi:hypothetical protein
MAEIKYLADINLSNNQLTNVKLQNLTADPSGLSGEGQIYYHSNDNLIKFHTGSDNWVSLSSASGDITGVTAGNGLTGGGNSGGVSLAVGAGNGITVNSGDVAITAAQTTITSVLNASLVIGRDADNDIDFGTDNNIIFRAGAADQIVLKDGVLEPVTDDDVDLGSSSKQFKNGYFDGTLEADVLSINGTAVTSTAAELNILDGVTATASELNIMDGVTSTTAELNILDGVTSTAAELNILDGVTSTAAELNILDGVTSTTAELNVLDGITAVVGELNALDLGSTAVGTAIASKAVILDSSKDYTGIRNLTIAGLLTGSGRIIVDDTTDATSTTDGSLQTDGGLSVAKDVVIGDDLIMLSDSAQIAFGANKEVLLKHDHNEGLVLQHSATADGAGTVLTLQSAEAALTANEEIAALQFDPSDSDGTDGTAISARIAAIAEGTFSASNNSTRLEFQLGQSEAASTDTARMTLSSAGLLTITDDLVIKNGGTIGAANDTDLLTMGNGILTVAGEVSMTTLDIGGTNVSATAAELNILDGVTATASELNIMDGVTSTTAELNILDGVTATAAELNVLDGITAVVGELNALDIGSTAVGTAVASKAVILDSNKDYTGIRNLTISGNLSVTGTTTTVNTVTMNAENAIVFEGATADSHETTLTIVDPTADHTYKLPDLGSTNDEGYIAAFAADPGTSPLITSTPTELNLLDGVTSTTAELNILDGVTSTAAELNILDGVTSTTAELNILDGVTATASELNIMDGVTATTAELNIMDGVTATAAEINLIDGGTSRGTTAVSNGDGFLHNDGGTMRMTNVSKLADLMAGTNISASSSVLSVANGAVGTKGVVTLASTAEALAGSSSSLAVTPAGLAARSFKATIGDGSDVDITIQHDLGTRDVIVQCYDASSYETVYVQAVRTDANNVTIDTNVAAASNDLIVLITKVD